MAQKAIKLNSRWAELVVLDVINWRKKHITPLWTCGSCNNGVHAMGGWTFNAFCIAWFLYCKTSEVSSPYVNTTTSNNWVSTKRDMETSSIPIWNSISKAPDGPFEPQSIKRTFKYSVQTRNAWSSQGINMEVPEGPRRASATRNQLRVAAAHPCWQCRDSVLGGSGTGGSEAGLLW